MALQKTHTLPNGVELNYWALKTATEFDYHAMTCRLWILAWVSEDAKNNGSSYVAEASKTYTVDMDKFIEYFDDSVLQQEGKSLTSQAYAYIKATDPFFADALDV